MRNTGLTLLAAGLAGIGVPLQAAPKSSVINVTTTVYDCSGVCDGSNQLLLRSDGYNVPGGGYATYITTPTRGPQVAVSSAIESNGVFTLRLQNQSVRTLYLTPNVPVGSQPPGPPPGYYWDNVTLYSVCRDQSNNNVPFENLVNGSGNCSLAVNFSYNGTLHKLVMSPQLPGPGPATGLASAACNAVSSGQCVDWTISPNEAAPSLNVANLYRYYSAKGSASWIFLGQYYNTFRIRITNP